MCEDTTSQKMLSDAWVPRTIVVDKTDAKPPNRALKIPQLAKETDTYAIVWVPSHRRDGLWHEITIDKVHDKWYCDCDGFRYTGRCVDISVLQWYGTLKRRHKKKGVQDTSIEAYRSLSVADLSRKRRSVFLALHKMGRATDKELAEFLHWPINTVTPRRGELYDIMFIERDGYKTDEKTQKTVTVWKCIEGIELQRGESC